MSMFSPIRGLCPTPGTAQDVAELPYDVMTRGEAIAMAAGRPHSFLHVSRPDIDLPEDPPADGPAAHALAAAAFRRMQEEGVLVRREEPGFHAYRLTRGSHVQTGVVGGASVEAYDSGRIRRHETTRPAKQADRAAHIEAVGAQTGPAFLIHEHSQDLADVLDRVTAAPAPTLVMGPGGVLHEVWPIDDPEDISAIVVAFDALPAMYIADGHHRSAAASAVHARRGTTSSSVFLAVAFPADEVEILAYNRLARAPRGMTPGDILEAVEARFEITPAPAAVTPDQPGSFGMYLDGRWHRLVAPPHLHDTADPVDRLDVSVLQNHLLGPVLGIGDPRTDPRIDFAGGTRPPEELAAAVDDGTWTVALTLFPTTVDDLITVSDAGGIMPPKSTWFEPKLLDGLVCHVLD